MLAILTGHTCGDACWHAREAVCRCSCGGKNHGILLQGGARPERTAKIGGAMYRLAEIGTDSDIEARRMAEVRAMNHHWLFDPAGPWLRKVATASQLKAWAELEAYRDTGASILWKAV